MKDTNARLDALGTEGVTNPFDSIYFLVFQLTVRMVGCREIADDPVGLKKFLALFEDVEKSSTMFTILFPWIPGEWIFFLSPLDVGHPGLRASVLREGRRS